MNEKLNKPTNPFIMNTHWSLIMAAADQALGQFDGQTLSQISSVSQAAYMPRFGGGDLLKDPVFVALNGRSG